MLSYLPKSLQNIVSSGIFPIEVLRRITLPFLTFLFLLGFQLSISQPVQAAAYEEQVVGLINGERQKQNLTPYNNSDKLFQASLDHNTLMSDCAKKYGNASCFKHQVTLLNEPTLMTRIKATGYNPQAVAENIAWGYSTPASVVDAWMKSSGHRANILGSYKDIGCDYHNPYWTCDFGRSYSVSTSTPTPTPTRFITPTPTKSPSSTLANTPTPTPTKTSNPTSFSTPTPTSIIPGPTSTSTAKPWWCKYVPESRYCI